MSRASSPAVQQIWLEPLHPGQARAYRALIGHRFMALRFGRLTGGAPELYVQMQAQRDLWLAEQRLHDALLEIVPAA